MRRNLDDLISESLYIIRAFGGKNPAVSFSGGKDSLVALDLSVRAGIKKAVFSNTTIEFEETVKYVERIRDFYGINLEIVRPPKNFFQLMEIFGFPSRRMRWCCEALKFGPLGKYALNNCISSFITGLRSNESKKRKKYNIVGKNPALPVPQINPLLNWKEEEIWQYIEEFSLPVNPLYKYGLKRVGCWPCPFKTKKGWEIIRKNFPHLIRYLNFQIKKLSKKFSVGIRDVNDFILKMAWVKHAFTQVSEIKCDMKLNGNKMTISFENIHDLNRVLKLLPIISKGYSVQGNKVILECGDIQSIRTLVEKVINCVGCGACLTLCDKNALYLNNGTIAVNVDRCTHCKNCLRTSKLRGACLRRNYAPRKFVMREYSIRRSNYEEAKIKSLPLCSTSEIIGKIRSKKSMHKIMENISRLGKVTRIEKHTIIVRNGTFTAIFKQNKGILEVHFRTSRENFDITTKVIRSFLA